MVKILRVITRLNIGGPAIHAILLSGSFNNKDGYMDILVTGKESASEGSMANLARTTGVVPIVLPELGREISFSNDIKAFFKLFRIMRSEKPDIVHTHTAKAGTLGRLAAICAGVPIKVHTFHGHVFDSYFSPWKARCFLVIEKILALFTDKVVTVSESVRNEIVNKLKVTDDRKCVVIPLGFELEKFLKCEDKKGLFRKEMGFFGNTMLVGIVGRLVPIKNHTMFLDAAKKIAERYKDSDIVFVVVGDGELTGELKAYAGKIGVEKQVIFTGWRDDLPTVYADLDIVTLTSLNEGTPVSLIEAMAAKRAIVATDVGGVRDLLGEEETGLLVESGDAEGLARKIVYLLKNANKRTELGMRGRDSVARKYSKERLLGDMQALYEGLLAARKRGKVVA